MPFKLSPHSKIIHKKNHQNEQNDDEEDEEEPQDNNNNYDSDNKDFTLMQDTM